MSLAELRDLLIVIFAIVGILAMLIFIIISLLAFSKVRSILDSGMETAASIRKVSSLVSDGIAKPLVGIASFLRGLYRALEFISGGSRRKEEDSGERGR